MSGTILILGGSGLVGKNLLKNKEVRRDLDDVKLVGTYYKNYQNHLKHFDIQNMNISDIEINVSNLSHVIFSNISSSKLDEFKKNWDKNPEKEFTNNVSKVINQIDYCFTKNIVPIFFSSDAVFDGTKGDYKENDQHNPINTYGFVKSEIENFLIKSKQKYIILRFGRVLSTVYSEGTIFTNIIRKLYNKERQLLFNNHSYTPIFINDLCEIIYKIIECDYTGILHVASLSSTTHFDLGVEISELLHLDEKLIIPCSSSNFKLLEKRGVNLSLNVERMRKILPNKPNSLKNYLTQTCL